jgi:hypothetical protein
MRKWFWCCAVAGVAAAGAYTAMYYAYGHPDSTIGRGVGVAMQSWSGFTPLTAEREAGGDEVAEGFVPDEPRPVTGTPILELSPETTLSAVLDMPTPKRLSGGSPIVIEENPELTPPSTVDLAGLGKDENTEGVTEVAYFPKVMPFAPEDSAPTTPMPPAKDYEANEVGRPDTDSAGQTFTPQSFLEFWIDVFVQPVAPAKQEPGDVPNCVEDMHFHHRDMGCPYSGCPGYYPIVPKQTDTPKGSEENSEMPMKSPRLQKKLRELVPGDVDCEKKDSPRHPEVDTMEYRKSDGKLNELPLGPF